MKKRVASDTTKIAPKTIFPLAWSYSRLAAYRECPKKFMYKFVEKLIEPQSPAMARGQELHELFEHYVRGGRSEFKEKIHTNCMKWLTPIRSMNPVIEEGCAFDKDWKRVEWFARNTACRVKMDLLFAIEKSSANLKVLKGPFPIAIVIDYKTGQIKPEEHQEQLDIYALAAYLRLEQVKAVQTGVWYIDHEEKPRFMKLFTDRKNDIIKLKRYWEGETKKMLADRAFKARPTQRCSWCAFSKFKGGPCKEAAA